MNNEKINTLIQAVDLGLPSGLKWATCNVGRGEKEFIILSED